MPLYVDPQNYDNKKRCSKNKSAQEKVDSNPNYGKHSRNFSEHSPLIELEPNAPRLNRRILHFINSFPDQPATRYKVIISSIAGYTPSKTFDYDHLPSNVNVICAK